MKRLVFKITNIHWDRCRKKGFDRSTLPKEVTLDCEKEGLNSFVLSPLEDTDLVGMKLNHFLCAKYGPKNNYFEFEEMWV